jgi:hypothetical protein
MISIVTCPSAWPGSLASPALHFWPRKGLLLLDHGSLFEMILVREVFFARPTKKALPLKSEIKAAICRLGAPGHFGALNAGQTPEERSCYCPHKSINRRPDGTPKRRQQ